jgi:DNA-directed RNA polymerase sigma subunit (sigma70/sigma32)
VAHIGPEGQGEASVIPLAQLGIELDPDTQDALEGAIQNVGALLRLGPQDQQILAAHFLPDTESVEPQRSAIPLQKVRDLFGGYFAEHKDLLLSKQVADERRWAKQGRLRLHHSVIRRVLGDPQNDVQPIRLHDLLASEPEWAAVTTEGLAGAFTDMLNFYAKGRVAGAKSLGRSVVASAAPEAMVGRSQEPAVGLVAEIPFEPSTDQIKTRSEHEPMDRDSLEALSGMILCARDASIELNVTPKELPDAGVDFWQRARALLTAKQYAALHAHYVEGKVQDKIAEALNMSRQRVGALLSEGKQKLYAAIEEGVDFSSPRPSTPRKSKADALAGLLAKHGESVEIDIPEEELRQRVIGMLGRLGLKSSHLTYMYARYGLEADEGAWLTQEQAADKVGLSRSTVAGLERRVIGKLQLRSVSDRSREGRGRSGPNKPKNGSQEFLRKFGIDMPNDTSEAELKRRVADMLDGVPMSEHERRVMGQRYGIDRADGVGLTLAQTAAELGISRRYVTTLEASVAGRLRELPYFRQVTAKKNKQA